MLAALTSDIKVASLPLPAGTFDESFRYINSFIYINEFSGMSCRSGKVRLPVPPRLPMPESFRHHKK